MAWDYSVFSRITSYMIHIASGSSVIYVAIASFDCNVWLTLYRFVNMTNACGKLISYIVTQLRSKKVLVTTATYS